MTRGWITVAVTVAMVVVGLPLGSSPAAAVSSSIVISQVYGGGGNTGAFYKNDFIELYNLGTSAVNVSTWSVQYASSAGTTWTKTNLAGTIQPGRYYLVQQAAGAGGQASLPTPDATGTTAMSAAAAKVALVNNQTIIATGTSCPSGASIVDFVGYGTGTNCFEGAGPTATLANTTAAMRNGGGATDTDSNTADFTVGLAGPRNSAITDVAPYILATSPASGALGVARNANVVLNASEPVNTTSSWYAISCAASGTHAASATGSGTSVLTIDPLIDFTFGEVCTVTVSPSLVTDVDTNDPPDPLVLGPAWSFTVASTPLPGALRIHDIQGAAHVSPKLSQSVVNVPGIVTGVRTNGFYMQDPAPDSDIATSEGIFVFTSSAPTITVGDSVVVSASVSEFRPGGSNGTSNLTTTELTGPSVALISTGNSLPPATVIGPSGRTPPTSVIEDDATGDVETSGTFDPATDGVDFWESLEGMRVDLGTAAVVGPSNRFFEISVLANDGADATGRSAHGGVVISATDKNPERVIIKGVGFNMPSNLNVGDRLNGPIVGIVDYDFGNFMIQVFTPPTRVDGGLTREMTTAPVPHQLTIATFNVENLSPRDPASKFQTLAGLIVNNLLSPDVISLEEVQDNNGSPEVGGLDDGTVDASQTLTQLSDAVHAAGGPIYDWRQINPVNDQDGGAPGGNIRQVLFFRSDRGLGFVDRSGAGSITPNAVVTVAGQPQLQYSPGRIDPTNTAFSTSRKPLAAEFIYGAHHLFVVANHFNSKGGDKPLWGHFQPPTLSSEIQRTQQATVVRNFVQSILSVDTNAEVVVLGDLNDFEFSNPVNILKGAPLNDLIETLPANERYTYVFEGNSQTLDHILVSNALLHVATTDVVHVNSEFWDQASDHEPQVAVLYDPIAPTITAPPHVTAATGSAATSCGTFISEGTIGSATASDNFPGVTVVRAGVPAGNVFPVGDTTITYTATDAVGNTAAATQIVTVIDNSPPSLTAPVAITLGTATTARVVSDLGTAITSDNCGLVTVGLSGVPAGNVFPLGVTTILYTASDVSGNTTSATQTVTIVDDTSPTITFSGNAGTYTVAQNVAIACAITDAGSGIDPASQRCDSANGPAYTFGLGSHDLIAEAVDKAGNRTSARTSFVVVVTGASLCALTHGFVAQDGIANSLCVKLEAAAAALERGNTKAHDDQLAAFMNEMSAQRAKAISDANADILIALAGGL